MSNKDKDNKKKISKWEPKKNVTYKITETVPKKRENK